MKKKQALHALFDLADGDHSGHVDPKELADILHSLGWNIKFKACIDLAEKIGAHADDLGQLILTESQFVNAMSSGKIATALAEMNIAKTSMFRTKASKNSAMLDTSHSTKLTDTDQLVKWTLRSSIISNSLSGATQLLLLAHTPVSRKVFQYFHCNDLAGRKLMRADYDIECYAPDHYAFMPVVLLVMAGFTIALPATILFYLWRHRHNLYTTKTHQRMGWLYDSFVRGAEFWQVHDLLMKMVLTGMLIYIPPTSRAGIAILICVAAVANLNFFQPHKNKVLFWLSQISFVTTTAKYTVALLLSSSSAEEEQKIIANSTE